MSYPFIGMPGILPEGQEWDAATIEAMLRYGNHIYLENEESRPGDRYMVRFAMEHGTFDVTDETSSVPEAYVILFSTPSFLELAVWIAFMGRDFL